MKEVWLITTGDKYAMWAEDYGMEVKGIFSTEQKAKEYAEQLEQYLKKQHILECTDINCYSMEIDKGEEF